MRLLVRVPKGAGQVRLRWSTKPVDSVPGASGACAELERAVSSGAKSPRFRKQPHKNCRQRRQKTGLWAALLAAACKGGHSTRSNSSPAIGPNVRHACTHAAFEAGPSFPLPSLTSHR